MRVLVVEDEAKLAELLARGLREEGYAADVSGSGEDALWMAKATAYDAIVLDVMLPGIDGFATCRRLRESGVWTPVLILTARDDVDDRITGLDTGADDYLVKPFAFAELLARLRALSRRAADRAPGPADRRRPAAGSRSAQGLARRDRARPLGKGVRPARGLHAPARPGALAGAAARRSMGHDLRTALEHRRRLRSLPAREDRQTVRPPLARDRTAGRLPPQRRHGSVTRISLRLRLTLAFTLVLALVLAAMGFVVYRQLGGR